METGLPPPPEQLKVTTLKLENRQARTILNRVRNAVEQIPEIPKKVEIPGLFDAHGQLPNLEAIPGFLKEHPERTFSSAMVQGLLKQFCPNILAARTYMEKSGNTLPPSIKFSAAFADLWDGVIQPLVTPFADPMYLREVGTNLHMAAKPPPL